MTRSPRDPTYTLPADAARPPPPWRPWVALAVSLVVLLLGLGLLAGWGLTLRAPSGRHWLRTLDFPLVPLWLLGGLLLSWLGWVGSRAALRSFAHLRPLRAAWIASDLQYGALLPLLPKTWQMARPELGVLALLAPHSRALLLLGAQPPMPDALLDLAGQWGVRPGRWVPDWTGEPEVIAESSGHTYLGPAELVARQLLYFDEIAELKAGKRQAGRALELERGQALLASAPPGWMVRLKVVMLTSNEDIDALVTGPDDQRWNVDIKSHRGPPSLRDGVLHLASDPMDRILEQLKRQSREAFSRPLVWQPQATHTRQYIDGVTFISGFEPSVVWTELGAASSSN